MSTPNTPTILASALERISGEAALDLVDKLLGPSNEWPSELIEYRLSVPFQPTSKNNGDTGWIPLGA